MKTHYSNDFASCEIRESEVLPAGVRELSSLYTAIESRQQGYATELLQAVCNDADIEGMVLVLSPADSGLQAFYKRFGFIEIQPRPVLMARAPQLFKVKMNPMSSAVVSACNGR